MGKSLKTKPCAVDLDFIFKKPVIHSCFVGAVKISSFLKQAVAVTKFAVATS